MDETSKTSEWKMRAFAIGEHLVPITTYSIYQDGPEYSPDRSFLVEGEGGASRLLEILNDPKRVLAPKVYEALKAAENVLSLGKYATEEEVNEAYAALVAVLYPTLRS